MAFVCEEVNKNNKIILKFRIYNLSLFEGQYNLPRYKLQYGRSEKSTYLLNKKSHVNAKVNLIEKFKILLI